MYSGQAIVLRNLRQIPPNTAKVIRLQKQLVEAVQRYQELNAIPDKDEAVLQELFREISEIDKNQREELSLVREAELNYTPEDIQNDLYCSEKLSDGDSPSKNGAASDFDEKTEFRITGEQMVPKPSHVEEAILEDVEEEPPLDESPMDWEDLTREQWSESDRLLQKIEKLGSKVLQRDFMSSVELVHHSHYKKAEEALAQRKQKAAQGKQVFTTGPWQIIDIPSKVTNRRCNYLTGLHVTVRQKDPKRAVATNSLEIGGVKTRHHESRGSSRASSRASSPISSLTEGYNNNAVSTTKLLRSIKTRATKNKKAVLPPTIKNGHGNSIKSINRVSSSSSNSNSSNKSETADNKNNNRALEPCVTYTLVDGVPHFKVFFPSSKESTNGAKPKSPSPFSSPHIVESDIEIIQTTPEPRVTPDRKSKPSPKPIKRPRLSHPPAKPGPSSTEPAAAAAEESTNNKEDLGLCIEKCGSWMGAPHFKIYRTFPTVNSTCASSVAPDWSGSSTAKPVLPAPKLTSPITAPKLAVQTTPSTPLPAMPKLTIGNQSHKSPVSPPGGGKFVPIAPKVPNLPGGMSNIVILPFADKNQHQPVAMKRPISLLKSSQNPTGSFLTVKNLKECLQNNKQYKDMKVVVQKVPVATGDVKKTVKLSEDVPTASPTVIVADMSI